MAIYGTALLSLCLLAGLIGGKLIGMAIGVDANVGGVGMAMLLLIVCSGWLQDRGRMSRPSREGVLFWSCVYIPIVVAMASSQNVRGALDSGLLPIVAGVVVVLASFAAVPLISRIGRPEEAIAAPLETASVGDEA